MEASELLGRVKAEAPTKPGMIVVPYGPTGIGKTTMFSQGYKPVIVEVKDTSSGVLKESGQMAKDVPVIQTDGAWLDSLAVLGALADTEHDYKTIVIDGGSGLSEACDDFTITESFDGNHVKFIEFGKGERRAAFEWVNLMNILERMKQRGLIVFLLAHQGTHTIKNPMGDDYIKSVPAISKEKLSMTVKYTDAILFMNFVTAQKDVSKLNHVGKAVGGESRIMFTKPSAAYEAKNRLNLADPIQLGSSHQESWQNFVAAMKAAKQGKGETK